MELGQAPVQQIHAPLFEQMEVSVFVKREDLNHPFASGNKYHKLKYNLQEAKKQGHDTLLTFGGAYSNHIYAVAGIGKAEGFKTIGVIRGEEHLPLNHTLQSATDFGMHLHYIDRSTYRLKNTEKVKQTLHKYFNDFYLIPEGGTNELAIKGTSEMLKEESNYDYYACPVGTGGTMAGIIHGLNGQGKVLGFSALKGDFLTQEVTNLLTQVNGQHLKNWCIKTDYHFGGYAKTNFELMDFMKAFEEAYDFLLEPVYTAKMFYGLFDMIEKGAFEKGTSILAIHTGGLQGRAGFGLAH